MLSGFCSTRSAIKARLRNVRHGNLEASPTFSAHPAVYCTANVQQYFPHPNLQGNASGSARRLKEQGHYSVAMSWSTTRFGLDGLAKKVAAKPQAAANDSHTPGMARFPETRIK